jgi:hypothetical protein
VPVGGGFIRISVFDVADHVPGITGTLEILRAGTMEKSLHVSDMVEIVNTSNPPITQSGQNRFEVSLPANAKLDTVLAASPGKIAVVISARPLSGQEGHYAVNFPLRPGATKFAFNYDVPYDGRAMFQTWHAYPLQQLAVMIPPTMNFSSGSSNFQILSTGTSNFQVRAVGPVRAGSGPIFTISGSGGFPALPDPSQAKISAEAPVFSNLPAPAPDRIVTAAPRYRSFALGALFSWPTPLWTLLGCVLFLALFSLIAWRAQKMRDHAGGQAGSRVADEIRRPTNSSKDLRFEDLKEKLFRVETARLRGSISGERYDSARRALEDTIERALAEKRDHSTGD